MEVETTQRSKGRARVYFFTSAVIYFMLVLDSIISLGAFGVLQKRVANSGDNLPPTSKCILFAHYDGKRNGRTIFKLSDVDTCAYILWGLVSVSLLTFAWLVYTIVLIFIGPRL